MVTVTVSVRPAGSVAVTVTLYSFFVSKSSGLLVLIKPRTAGSVISVADREVLGAKVLVQGEMKIVSVASGRGPDRPGPGRA